MKGVPTLSRRAFPFVERVFADGGCAGLLFGGAQDKAHPALEIGRRPPWAKGASSYASVGGERPFAWIMKCRRLVRDCEPFARVAEALITVAAIATRVRRR